MSTETNLNKPMSTETIPSKLEPYSIPQNILATITQNVCARVALGPPFAYVRVLTEDSFWLKHQTGIRQYRRKHFRKS